MLLFCIGTHYLPFTPFRLLSSGVHDVLYFLRLFPPSLKGCILSAVDKNSGRTAIHIHREPQYARKMYVSLSFTVFKCIARDSSTDFPGDITSMSRMCRPHLGFGHLILSIDNRLPALICNKGTRQNVKCSCLIPFYRLYFIDFFHAVLLVFLKLYLSTLFIPSATAAYCPEMKPPSSRCLSAMKDMNAPCCLPAHTAQNSWKAHSL